MKKLLTIGLVSIFAFMLMPQAMAATPTITSISPSTMYFSGSAFTSSGTRYLYIWGSSFETNAKVIIDSGSNGSQTLTPYTVQNGFIGVQVSSDKLSNGTHSVLVQNPVIFAGTETSNTKTFTVTGSSYTGSSDNSGDDPEESTDDPEDSGDEPEESGDDPEDSGDEPEDSNDGSEEGTDNTCTSIFGFAINCPEDQTDESGDDASANEDPEEDNSNESGDDCSQSIFGICTDESSDNSNEMSQAELNALILSLQQQLLALLQQLMTLLAAQ